ncbi:MAG TPA: SMP-30/gluconolactonase/LRE family protein [Acidimicrobiia bacterium]|nr:SMP-30/gluconolactonase/LRE family protein [Acidimicrobiia bacterium]
MSLEIVSDVRCALAEGPRFYDGVLTWVDIEGCALYRLDGSLSVERFDSMVGCANPTADGDIVVALADRILLVSTGEVLARFPHAADLRANDGACDPSGRLWVGTTAVDHRADAGALYRLDQDGLTSILDGLTIANGIGWSPDGSSMYYVDTPTERVDVYPYDGGLGARATFAEVDGHPDGLTVDDEGFVWVAFYGGSRVERRAPDGSLDRVVPVPTENVTSCCFGGTTLYITSGRGDGRVYAYDAGVSGPQATPFRRTAPSDAEATSAR